LEALESSEEKIVRLTNSVQAANSKAQKLATALTASRKQAFTRLNDEISESLAFLNMPGIQMALQQETAPLSADGQDKLEFLISTNPGEAPKPLAKIASGGELARIMLAIKNALADKDDVPTVIYDEVDTGISGLAAGRIGQLLRNTAKGRQVLCVTHTAQVAAYAAHHLLIEKEVAGGRTYTHIRRLNDEERVAELARIIAGDHVTDLALASAREMLQMAGTTD